MVERELLDPEVIRYDALERGDIANLKLIPIFDTYFREPRD